MDWLSGLEALSGAGQGFLEGRERRRRNRQEDEAASLHRAQVEAALAQSRQNLRGSELELSARERALAQSRQTPAETFRQSGVEPLAPGVAGPMTQPQAQLNDLGPYANMSYENIAVLSPVLQQVQEDNRRAMEVQELQRQRQRAMSPVPDALGSVGGVPAGTTWEDYQGFAAPLAARQQQGYETARAEQDFQNRRSLSLLDSGGPGGSPTAGNPALKPQDRINVNQEFRANLDSGLMQEIASYATQSGDESLRRKLEEAQTLSMNGKPVDPRILLPYLPSDVARRVNDLASTRALMQSLSAGQGIGADQAQSLISAVPPDSAFVANAPRMQQLLQGMYGPEAAQFGFGTPYTEQGQPQFFPIFGASGSTPAPAGVDREAALSGTGAPPAAAPLDRSSYRSFRSQEGASAADIDAEWEALQRQAQLDSTAVAKKGKKNGGRKG